MSGESYVLTSVFTKPDVAVSGSAKDLSFMLPLPTEVRAGWAKLQANQFSVAHLTNTIGSLIEICCTKGCSTTFPFSFVDTPQIVNFEVPNQIVGECRWSVSSATCGVGIA